MHDGARDIESVMNARYWLTDKGWAATEPPNPPPVDEDH